MAHIQLKKFVLITGGGSGIGLATVKKFLSENWTVYAHYHQTVKDLEILQKKHKPGTLNLLKYDLKDPSDLNKFLKHIGKLKIHALVNNAGDHDASLESRDRIKDIQSTFLLNTIAPALIAEKVLKSMKRAQKGHIVNVSSIGAKYGSGTGSMFYGASKGGLEAITKTLAREGAPYGVLVNAIRPGLANTSFIYRVPKNIKKRVAMIPLKRMAQPLEIAEFIFYLCSNNSYITSEILAIAGGE